jgi:hypothetical protein
MDKPADPATPFAEVYQAFLADLATEGTKPSTVQRYRHNIVRFEKWLVETGHAATLASLERTTFDRLPSASRDAAPAAGRSIRRPRGGLMSRPRHSRRAHACGR